MLASLQRRPEAVQGEHLGAQKGKLLSTRHLPQSPEATASGTRFLASVCPIPSSQVL